MFGQSQGNIIYFRLLIKITILTLFQTTCWNNFHQCCLFLYKSLSWRIWPCYKIGQCHHRIIMWSKIQWAMVPCAIYQSSWKSHLWFQGTRCLRLFKTYGRGSHLVMWPTFSFPRTLKFTYKILSKKAKWFLLLALKFDLYDKYVKVNPLALFIHTMMGLM